jgi:protein phosphatase 1 regulatory subunit 11
MPSSSVRHLPPIRTFSDDISQIVCCIYRKPRAFDESSSEESSSDDGSGPDDDGAARPASNGNPRRRGNNHHRHLHEHGEDGTCQADGSANVAQLEDKAEPNAYERTGKGKGKSSS